MGESQKRKHSRTLEENLAYYVDLESAASMIQTSSMTDKNSMLRKIKERKHRLKKRIEKQFAQAVSRHDMDVLNRYSSHYVPIIGHSSGIKPVEG